MRVTLATAVLVVLLVCQPFPLAAAPPRRVVVVTIDGTRLDDWRDQRLATFDRILKEGAVALVSTRTATPTSTLAAARTEAYRIVGSGRFSSMGDPAALATQLERVNRETTIITGEVRGPARLLAGRQVSMPNRVDPNFPSGVRTDYGSARGVVRAALDSSSLIIVDVGDTIRVESAYGGDESSRSEWMAVALAEADSFLAWLEDQLTPDDLLILAAVVPPHELQRARRFLAPFAMMGGGVVRGLLTTTTTRRTGVVTLADVAPSILRRLDTTVPQEMTGRPMRALPHGRAVASAHRLESRLLHAASVRKPLLRAIVVAASAFVVIGSIAVARGYERSPRSSGMARGQRRFLEIGCTVVFALPLAVFAEPLYRTLSLGKTVTAVAVVASAIAVLLRRAVGTLRAIRWLSTTTVAVVLGDLVTGGGLAESSPLSYLIAEGARFHGIGNDAMGLVIVSAVVVSAYWLSRTGTPRRAVVVVALLVTVAGVMAAPQVGAKFGAIPTALPPFALLALLSAGVRLRAETLIGIAILTIVAADLVVVADALSGGASHVAGALGSGAGEVIARKIRAAGRLLALSYWAGGLIACVGSVALLVTRGPEAVRRQLSLLPAARRVLVSCALAAAAAIVANDAGVTAACWIMLLASTFLLAELLSRQAMEQTGEARA